MTGTFKQRVRELAEHVGGAGKLAEGSGLSRRTIGAYLAGETDPKRSDLLKLASAGNISLEWLAAGKGAMLDGASATPDARLRYHSAQLARELKVAEPAMELRAGYVYLPLYDELAAAGGGELVGNEDVVDVLAFKESWIRQQLHVAPADLRLIHVVGDSMEPDLRAGDIILIDHTDTAGSREGIYVIRMDAALLVKQLQRLPGGTVRVISRNQAYEPFSVPLSALNAPGGPSIIGRVVWACRRL